VSSEAGRAYQAGQARVCARSALETWYSYGYRKANAQIPRLQRESNEKEFGCITPGNGYVVLLRMFSGTLKLLTLSLDGAGGLTYRQLHRQVRAHLEIDAKHSLRICSWRPWYGFITDQLLPPELYLLMTGSVKTFLGPQSCIVRTYTSTRLELVRLRVAAREAAMRAAPPP
jgi:hypothetical protein